MIHRRKKSTSCIRIKALQDYSMYVNLPHWPSHGCHFPEGLNYLTFPEKFTSKNEKLSAPINTIIWNVRKWAAQTVIWRIYQWSRIAVLLKHIKQAVMVCVSSSLVQFWLIKQIPRSFSDFLTDSQLPWSFFYSPTEKWQPCQPDADW